MFFFAVWLLFATQSIHSPIWAVTLMGLLIVLHLYLYLLRFRYVLSDYNNAFVHESAKILLHLAEIAEPKR
jgi:hypothetical protein